ncbi:IS630 family transposase [Moorena sp. SIO1G6]|uniref:IS630 family transposase n=1 Tax=Moorena sp. SIO1G6 TaxID=2607840 RepID=UPI00257E09BD|nr:IS630 family transposase [Moorena sp. SIO1G6]
MSKEEASRQLEALFRQSPRRYNCLQTRWRLQDVGRAIAWLEGMSEPGIYKVLKRLGFSRKQALSFIHSPDPEYQAKWQRILRAYQEAITTPEKVVLLFQDELTYYRRPSKSKAWHQQGKKQPLAHEAPRSNTKTRIAAALDGILGRVIYLQRSTIGKDALIKFHEQIRLAYPHAETIYLVQDNWPCHKLPEVLQAAADNRVTPLFLPTYASWLNPIEKLWRWLKQEVIHLHPFAHEERLVSLRTQVTAFLDRFQHRSRQLLHYTGILPRHEPDFSTRLFC